jgi:gluconolactonase
MRKTKLFFFLSLMVVFIACNNESTDENSNDTTGVDIKVEKIEISPDELSIAVNDAENASFIDASAKIEVLATGFSWSEGPVWVDQLNAVLFSDVPNNVIYKWSEQDSLSVYLKAAGHTGEGNEKSNAGPNGLLLDPEGDLLVCQHGDRQIGLMSSGLVNPQNSFVSIAAKYQGKKYNSPNDLVLDSKGNLYFTDPPYGQPDNKTAEIGINGVYRVKTNGDVTLLVDTLKWPNGIALSQDEKTVYINNSDPDFPVMYSYQFDEKGKLTDGKVFFNFTEIIKEKPGSPDGLKLHKSGNLFAAGPGGVTVISPEGKLLASINTGRPTANCAFDTEQNYLYMTAQEALMRVKLNQ